MLPNRSTSAVTSHPPLFSGIGGSLSMRDQRRKRWAGTLLLIYAVSMPFTSAFALGPWLPLNLLALCVIIPLGGLVGIGISLREIVIGEALLVVAILAGMAGLMFAPSLGEKIFNHVLAITASTAIFYFYIRFGLLKYVSLEDVSRALAIGCGISAAFIILEFLLANFAGILVRNYIPYVEIRMADSFWDSTMLGAWIRPRGFCIEAGHMAAFFELTLPLSYIYMKKRGFLVRVLFYTLTVSGFLLLGSAAGITALSCSLGAMFLWRGVSMRMRLVMLAAVAAIGCVLYFDPNVRDVANQLIVDKTLTFLNLEQGQDFSSLDRARRLSAAIQIAKEFPFGIGWGTAPYLSENGGLNGIDVPFGFISLYAEFLVAGGIVGLTAFALFIFLSIGRWSRRTGGDSVFVVAACLSLAIHYATLSNFWHPFLWAAFAVANRYAGATKRPERLGAGRLRNRNNALHAPAPSVELA